MIWFVVAGGLFNIISALVMNTKDVPSAVFFKVIPFILGLGCILYSVSYFNLV
jgi:hypothetical protein